MPAHSHLKLSKELQDSPAPRFHSHNTYRLQIIITALSLLQEGRQL